MGTNATNIATGTKLEEETLRIPKLDLSQAPGLLDDAVVGKRTPETRMPDPASLPSAGAPFPLEAAEDFSLAPLVNKIAFGLARGLVVAMKELENHISSETRKVGDAVDRRLDTIQTSLQALSDFVAEQRSTNSAVDGRLQELAVRLQETDARHDAGMEAVRSEALESSASLSQRIDTSTALLQEADARLAADLEALQSRTNELSQWVSERFDALAKDLGIQQDDLAAVKATLCAFSSRVDALLERLDRQAETVRSMCAAYSQRETELEQLVDGLARLRAFPTPMPSIGL
jgi:septal ring factor EnvC (AmiA/AmiB activator)